MREIWKRKREQQQPKENEFSRFGRVVEAASKGGISTTSLDWRIYELPNTRVAVLHSPQEHHYSVLIQPKVLIREGPYVKYQLINEDYDSSNHYVKRDFIPNNESLEEIISVTTLTAENSSKIINEDVRKFEEASLREVKVVADVLQAMQQGYNAKKLGKIRLHMRAERYIGRLLDHFRDSDLPL